jgi:hypothetical protein
VESAVRQWLDRFLFTPASPLGLIVVRSILAAQALWIVLSRPGMAELTGWPGVFWSNASPAYVRFLIVPGAGRVDLVLYGVLVIALIAALCGIVPRVASLTSALLLYHFAPMEAVIGKLPTTASLSGLTLPLLGLLIIAFSPRPRPGDSWSLEFRWPLVLIQTIFVFHYVNAGLAKLHWAGFRWYTSDNVAHLAVVFWLLQKPSLSLTVWQHQWLAAAIGGATFVLEFGFPLTMFSKWARRVFLPLAFLAAILRIYVFGFFFLSIPSLLVMVNWDAVAAWMARRRGLDRATIAQPLPDPLATPASTTPSGQ